MIAALKAKLRDFLRYQVAIGSRTDEILVSIHGIERKLDDRSVASPAAPKPAEAALPGAARLSFAIEAEDLILERLLNVFVFDHAWRPGRYVDVGAHHPVSHSNTYLLYCKGWTGVCVEPNPEFAEDFAALRPNDRFVNAGLSVTASSLTYHCFDDPLINGFFGDDVVEIFRREGKRLIRSVEMPCLGVKEFLASYVPGPIDVLNIDIETQDSAVLEAWDWVGCRPSVICAEVPQPRIRAALRDDVVKVLESAGFSLVSRVWQSAFFVADEHIKRFLESSNWPFEAEKAWS